MEFFAFIAAMSTLPVALIATAAALICRVAQGKVPRPLLWITCALWVALGACIAFGVIAHSVQERWHVRGEYPSPDGLSAARVESQHVSFFSDYEVNFRLQIRDVKDGRVKAETVFWESEVVHHVWEVPGSAVEWSPDSTQAVLIVGRHRVALPR